MRVDTGLPIHDLSRVPEAAQRAEALGYDGALTPETGHDPSWPTRWRRSTRGAPIMVQIAGDSRFHSSTDNRAH